MIIQIRRIIKNKSLHKNFIFRTFKNIGKNKLKKMIF